MSQSDYLKYKRVATQLRIDAQPTVIESQKYVNFKEYTLENTIVNTKPILNRVTPKGRQPILGMDKAVSSCPTFYNTTDGLCSRSYNRPNRIPLSTVYVGPKPLPLTANQTKNTRNQNPKCLC